MSRCLRSSKEYKTSFTERAHRIASFLFDEVVERGELNEYMIFKATERTREVYVSVVSENIHYRDFFISCEQYNRKPKVVIYFRQDKRTKAIEPYRLTRHYSGGKLNRDTTLICPHLIKMSNDLLIFRVYPAIYNNDKELTRKLSL